MERLLQAIVYTCEEQPGDSTRYTHLIHITEDYVVVYRDETGSGAGLKKPILFIRSILESMISTWEWLKPADAVKITAEMHQCKGKDGENPWTVASAVRCSHVILKHLHAMAILKSMEEER